MDSKDIKYVINKKLSPKINLCYNTSLYNPEIDAEMNKNPIIKLLNNLDEIKSIINLNDFNYIKALYLNRYRAHVILYDYEEIIDIKTENNVYLFFYIYLSLLIKETLNIIDYSYSANFIEKLSVRQTELKSAKIRKIILAKIIIDLIEYYENNDYNEEKISELDKIKNYNKEVIKDNISEIKVFKLTENDIFSKKIDEIYSIIIKYFIENKRLDDSDDFTFNIFNQIDLQSINLTKIMFDSLSILLDKEKEYLKEFIIKDYDDLFNTKIINFYYTLFRYVIKGDYYIYQIPFLLEQRNRIKTLIKANLDKFYYSFKSKEDEENKIKYFLGTFTEYKYYLNESLKVISENEKMAPNKDFKDYDNNDNIISLFERSSGYFDSFKAESEKHSGRNASFDYLENENSGRYLEDEMYKNLYEYEELKNICGEEIAFKILCNSSFKFEFNRDKNNNIIYKCSEIKINKKIIEKSLDEIKAIIPGNDILKNNYAKFLNVLKIIIEKIKSDCVGDFGFATTFEFKGGTIQNSIFQIECMCNLEVNKRNSTYCLGNNIIEHEPTIGLYYLLGEINYN